MSSPCAYLGIDGGGSQTRSLLVNQDGRVLASASGGPGNALQLETGVLQLNLQNLIHETLKSIQKPVRLLSAAIGLAGTSAPESRDKASEVIATLEPQPEAGYALLTDIRVALTGALLDRPGLICIAGTGSICYGRDAGGELHRTGGWGSTFDDLGSGHWIGQEAIRRALQQADGRIGGSELLRAVLEHFKLKSLEALIPKINQRSLPHSEVASLCPVVCKLAQNKDASALEVVQYAAREICNLISTTMKKCSASQLVLQGGLLNNPSIIRQHLTELLEVNEPKLQIIAAVLSPCAGAVIEAYRNQHGCLPSSKFIDNLKVTA